MIEIPESICLAKQLSDTLVGKRIEDAVSMHSPHKFAFTYGDTERYPDLMIGKRFSKAAAHGSWVTMTFEDAVFLVSEGSRLFFTTNRSELPLKHHMLLKFDDDSYLVTTIQMYGSVICAKTGEFDNEYYRISLEKLSVLEDAFDESYFRGLITDRTSAMSAKAFLATEQRIPGLGNGVLQDILFHAGIHPRAKMKDLSEEQMMRLYSSVKSVVLEMVKYGGRDTEKDLFGNTCPYNTKMSKNTAGIPCSKCGTPIEKTNYMGGSIYFCRECQPSSKTR